MRQGVYGKEKIKILHQKLHFNCVAPVFILKTCLCYIILGEVYDYAEEIDTDDPWFYFNKWPETQQETARCEKVVEPDVFSQNSKQPELEELTPVRLSAASLVGYIQGNTVVEAAISRAYFTRKNRNTIYFAFLHVWHLYRAIAF